MNRPKSNLPRTEGIKSLPTSPQKIQRRVEKVKGSGSSSGGWITIGGDSCGEGSHCGGTHVFLRDGKIVAGPAALTGQSISDLKRGGKEKPEDKLGTGSTNPNEGNGPPKAKPDSEQVTTPKVDVEPEGSEPYGEGTQPEPESKPESKPEPKPEPKPDSKPEPEGNYGNDVGGGDVISSGTEGQEVTTPGGEVEDVEGGGGFRPEGRGEAGATDEGVGGEVAGASEELGHSETVEGGDDASQSSSRKVIGSIPRGLRSERVPAEAEKATKKIQKYVDYFRKKGQSGDHHLLDVAVWLDKVKAHVREVGTAEALKELGEEVGRKVGAGGRGEQVQYWGIGPEMENWKNDGDFIAAYLERNGIFSIVKDESEGGMPLVSSLVKPDRFVAGQDFKASSDVYKDKLDEAKHLPGLESSEDLSVVTGRDVTHLTDDVVSALDDKYGKGQWVVKCYSDEAAAGYGIYFPQKVQKIREDARNGLWYSGVALGQWGLQHIREPEFGNFGKGLAGLGDLTLKVDESKEPWDQPAEIKDPYNKKLLEESQSKGFYIDPNRLGAITSRQNVGGMEHDVFRDEGSGRYWKLTRDGNFGQNKDLPEYLSRHAMLNKLWPQLGYKFEGVTSTSDGRPRAVISMNEISGEDPEQGQIDDWFRKNGWEPLGGQDNPDWTEEDWSPDDWAWKDPKTGTTVRDAHSKNFKRTADGEIIPIDIDLYPGEGALKDLPKAEKDRVVGLRHEGGEEYWFGTDKYDKTINGEAREWGDNAEACADHENGTKLPEGKFMVQPAFPAVGISDAERAAGKTWHEKNEGRVHLITREDGTVEVIPHSTWLKGGNLPVVFEDDKTRAMAQAALETLQKLPPEARKGQVYAPDVMMTGDGFKVVELNAQGDTNGSGYLHDNGFTIDAFTSYLTGREPAHVAFIRQLLTKRKREKAYSSWVYKALGVGSYLRPVFRPVEYTSPQKGIRTKGKGTCKPGERADLTGCTPASSGGKKPSGKPQEKPSGNTSVKPTGSTKPVAILKPTGKPESKPSDKPGGGGKPVSKLPKLPKLPKPKLTEEGPSNPEERKDVAPKVLKWKDPPPKEGKKGGGNIKRPTGPDSQTDVGDLIEEASTALGFRNILPKGKRSFGSMALKKKKVSSIDREFDHSGRAYEIKGCNTTSTEYRLKAHKYEKAGKLNYAKKKKLVPYTAVAVRDVATGEVHFYGSKKPGMNGAEVSPKKFDYLGTVKFKGGKWRKDVSAESAGGVRVKGLGSCKLGERADLTGCTPASKPNGPKDSLRSQFLSGGDSHSTPSDSAGSLPKGWTDGSKKSRGYLPNPEKKIHSSEVGTDPSVLGDEFHAPVTETEIEGMFAAWRSLSTDGRQKLLDALGIKRTAATMTGREFGDILREGASNYVSGGLIQDRLKKATDIHKLVNELAAFSGRSEVATLRKLRETLRGRVKDSERISVDHYPGVTEREYEMFGRGMSYLNGVLQRGDKELGALKTYHAKRPDGTDDERAHYNPRTHQINFWDNCNAYVAVHETAHAIEYKIPGIKDAVRAFRKYRIEGDSKESLARFGMSGEYGYSDEFAKVMDEGHAIYTGKEYPDGSTEILSMGLEHLYRDPVGFCKKDPEYATFLIGVLDGTLRNKPLPE
jgi:hypothetical protein